MLTPTTSYYTKVAIALHSFLRTTESSVYCLPGFIDGEDGAGNVITGIWRRENETGKGGLEPIGQVGGNRYIICRLTSWGNSSKPQHSSSNNFLYISGIPGQQLPRGIHTGNISTAQLGKSVGSTAMSGMQINITGLKRNNYYFFLFPLKL